MDTSVHNGSIAIIDSVRRVFYDGYWVKTYPPTADTLQAKKVLIEALTRRLFNHVEYGINIPGVRLNEARHAYETENDPACKRVKGAMLAGALFNRATDIFTKLVELQALGISIDMDSTLMSECGNCLQEALSLGPLVRHRSGEESIDELWGEPFRAFSIPIEDFFESRYVKIAQTLRDIDLIASTMADTFKNSLFFTGIIPVIIDFSCAAKRRCETLSADPIIFEVWAQFVTCSERLLAFQPISPAKPCLTSEQQTSDGKHLLQQGCTLITDITLAHTAMPKTTKKYLLCCQQYKSETEKDTQST